MIPNQWYAILESREIKKGKPAGITRLGEKMVVWRDSSGRVTCMSDLCPHRGVALSAGKVLGDCIQCPFHGFKYDTKGTCRLIPANGRNATPPKAFRVKTYPTQEAHGFIYIWWGETRPEYPEVPWLSINDEDFSHFTFRQHWATHYSRAIENQLDVVHLPFVHHNTIGRGHRTLVNGPVVKVEECPGGSDMINFWVNNTLDTGQPPLPSSEIVISRQAPSLQFRFPNLWQNWISDGFRIMVAFVPIDNENTLMYLRTYQKVVKFAPLHAIFNISTYFANKIILRQDQRVVVTQRPMRTYLRMGEKLVAGDSPIIEYRRRREALIEAATNTPQGNLV